MTDDVPLYRLYLLRAAYLLVGGGLIVTLWPLILSRGPEIGLMNGVVWSMLGALSILALFGLRYPVQMLPLLLFEIGWKVFWALAYGLPLWLSDKMTEAHVQTAFEVGSIVIVLPAIPWSHVWRQYVMRKGDRWIGGRVPSPSRKSGA